MFVAALLMGVSLALYQIVNSLAASIGFNAMEYWFQSLYNALLYAYTPEAFPAAFRGSASGMLSTLGRIAGIIAPMATQTVYNGSDSPGVLWLGAGGAWVSALAIGECSVVEVADFSHVERDQGQADVLGVAKGSSRRFGQSIVNRL